MNEKELYEEGKTIYQIAEIVGISPTGVWKRLKKQGAILRAGGTRKGNHWSIEKRGVEFIGADGRVWVRGIRSSRKRNSKRRAIVVMEQILGKPIPRGYIVHHKNEDILDDSPTNLELIKKGSHNTIHHQGKSNSSKGSKGIKNPSAKADPHIVAKIRKMYSTNQYSQKSLGILFNLHQTTISHIVNNKTWKE